jgi:hypothetical protein
LFEQHLLDATGETLVKFVLDEQRDVVDDALLDVNG